MSAPLRSNSWSTSIFVGPPGAGKTLTARWLTSHLNMPLYVLDLTAVMGNLLERSGANLRAVFDYAKRTSCVLLLDAIAKRRSDDSDIGELKRLVPKRALTTSAAGQLRPGALRLFAETSLRVLEA